MLCGSCNKQKDHLNPVKSELLKGVNLLMCSLCMESKFEPRWVVILAARQNGAEYVRDYVIKNRYVGRKIFAEELIA